MKDEGNTSRKTELILVFMILPFELSFIFYYFDVLSFLF